MDHQIKLGLFQEFIRSSIYQCQTRLVVSWLFWCTVLMISIYCGSVWAPMETSTSVELTGGLTIPLSLWALVPKVPPGRTADNWGTSMHVNLHPSSAWYSSQLGRLGTVLMLQRWHTPFFFLPLVGFEPPTSGVAAHCANHYATRKPTHTYTINIVSSLRKCPLRTQTTHPFGCDCSVLYVFLQSAWYSYTWNCLSDSVWRGGGCTPTRRVALFKAAETVCYVTTGQVWEHYSGKRTSAGSMGEECVMIPNHIARPKLEVTKPYRWLIIHIHLL